MGDIRLFYLNAEREKKEIQEKIGQEGGRYFNELFEAQKIVVGALKDGHSIFIAGNGGSHADALHFAAELVWECTATGRRPLPVHVLGCNSATMTAVSNDFSYHEEFSRELEAFARDGDVFIGLSTSGRSSNIVSAVETARKKCMRSICLLGKSGGFFGSYHATPVLRSSPDCAIIVPSDNTQRIQEEHMKILHCLCEVIDVIFAE